jgi:hypothetical protein
MASAELYFVRAASGGTLFSKGDETYLFMGGGGRGYHCKLFTYPWIMLREFLGAPSFPNEGKDAILVIRVTPSIVERKEVSFGWEIANVPTFLTPFDDGFYAQCPGVVLCKWTGTSFETATEEEQRTHDGTNRLFKGYTDEDTVNGWIVRRMGSSLGDDFRIQVGNSFVVSAKNNSANPLKYNHVTVDLIRPGQVPERLYDVDGAVRSVSRIEYEKLFPVTP